MRAGEQMLTTASEHLSTARWKNPGHGVTQMAADEAGPAGRRTRREGDQLRGELLRAAAALAAGPRPVAIPSLRAVARACDVSAAAVYRHFSSQSALTRALLATQYEAFEAAVLHGDDPTQGAGDRARRLVRAYVRWGLTNPGMYQLLFESADQLGADSGIGDFTHETTELAQKLIAAGCGPDGRPPRCSPGGSRAGPRAPRRSFRGWTSRWSARPPR